MMLDLAPHELRTRLDDHTSCVDSGEGTDGGDRVEEDLGHGNPFVSGFIILRVFFANMPVAGIEPATSGLKVPCSTN